MNPWTGFLQALHSALIDELTERRPEPKPELGLPIRQSKFSFPASELTEALVCRVTLSQAQGMGLLSLSPDASKLLGLTTPELWQACMKRAGNEMHRRGIMPRFDGTETVKNGVPLPGHLPAVGRVIWIPLKLGEAAVFLGMGV